MLFRRRDEKLKTMRASDQAISINPFTEETIETFPDLSDTDLEQRLAGAGGAFRVWKETPVARRAEMLGRLGAALRQNLDKLALVITLEMGKTRRQSCLRVTRSC